MLGKVINQKTLEGCSATPTSFRRDHIIPLYRRFRNSGTGLMAQTGTLMLRDGLHWRISA